jgi:hypothetical protein
VRDQRTSKLRAHILGPLDTLHNNHLGHTATQLHCLRFACVHRKMRAPVGMAAAAHFGNPRRLINFQSPQFIPQLCTVTFVSTTFARVCYDGRVGVTIRLSRPHSLWSRFKIHFLGRSIDVWTLQTKHWPARPWLRRLQFDPSFVA